MKKKICFCTVTGRSRKEAQYDCIIFKHMKEDDAVSFFFVEKINSISLCFYVKTETEAKLETVGSVVLNYSLGFGSWSSSGLMANL